MQLNPSIGSTETIKKILDNGINTLKNNIIAFYTNGIERARMDSNGNFGIDVGITSVNERLQVNGRVLLNKVNVPTFTEDKLYNVNGTLYWNGIDLTASGLGGNWTMENGNVYRLTGNVGIHTIEPNIHLSIGDSNTGFNQEGENILGIYTNGSERIRINASGQVGINTTNFVSSEAKLGINGSIEIHPITRPTFSSNLLYNVGGKLHWNGIDITTTGIVDRIYDDDMTTFIQTKAYLEGINFHTNSVERMFIAANGNIGIGTHTPSSRLHIGSSGVLKFDNLDVGARLVLWDNGSGGYTGLGKDNGFLTLSVYSSANDFKFVHGNSQTEVMRLTGTGNIGLGKSNPSEKIHTYSSSSHNNILIEGTFGYNQGICIRDTSNQICIPANQNDMVFKTNSFPRMIIGKNGNIGIGILNPSETFHINGNSKFEGNINLIGNIVTSGNITTSGNFKSTSTLSTTFVGNVGINSSIPTEKLDVIGNAQLSGDFKVSGNTNVKAINAAGILNIYTGDTNNPLVKIRSSTKTGMNNSLIAFYSNSNGLVDGELEGDIRLDNTGGLSFLNASDRRLKTNIRLLTEGYNIVKNLPAVKFDWKKGNKPKNIQGFIAQEVEKFVPTAVSKMSNGLYGLNQEKLIPILWSAVRLLIEKIEKLEPKSK